MNYAEKEKIRNKHHNWVAYWLGNNGVNDILTEEQKLTRSPQKSGSLIRSLGFLIGDGYDNHHDWERPNEIYDYLPREEHRRRYHQ